MNGLTSVLSSWGDGSAGVGGDDTVYVVILHVVSLHTYSSRSFASLAASRQFVQSLVLVGNGARSQRTTPPWAQHGGSDVDALGVEAGGAAALEGAQVARQEARGAEPLQRAGLHFCREQHNTHRKQPSVKDTGTQLDRPPRRLGTAMR